ncbi:hypothetical protein Bca52824_081818 [Brassica carinata]|uniref:Uncharacterized protein n=1 Tax=Brassica carinata TaxID=52824 RepID=A0A8X7PJA4_BRACI|nr:hypothetical protein Bca52824_081818 [Brassica carinata]
MHADMTAYAQSLLREKPVNPTQKVKERDAMDYSWWWPELQSVFFLGGELSFSVVACVGPPSVGPWRQEALLFGGVVYGLPVTALTVSFSLFLLYTAAVLSSAHGSVWCEVGSFVAELNYKAWSWSLAEFLCSSRLGSVLSGCSFVGSSE